MSDEPQPVRLVVLGDPAGAPICEGDVCYFPPSAADSAPPSGEPEEGDRPQENRAREIV